MGIGARSEISFLLSRRGRASSIAIFAEMGTFVTLALGVDFFGLDPASAASVAIIGRRRRSYGAVRHPYDEAELFVSVSIIAYLYLSLTYAGYPYIIKALVPKKYRGIDIEFDMPQVSQKASSSSSSLSACCSACFCPWPLRSCCRSSSAWP